MDGGRLGDGEALRGDSEGMVWTVMRREDVGEEEGEKGEEEEEVAGSWRGSTVEA